MKQLLPWYQFTAVMKQLLPWYQFTAVMKQLLPWYQFTAVMKQLPPWYQFTDVMMQYLPWYQFTAVTKQFLPWYQFNRSSPNETLIFTFLLNPKSNAPPPWNPTPQPLLWGSTDILRNLHCNSRVKFLEKASLFQSISLPYRRLQLHKLFQFRTATEVVSWV